MPKRYTAWVEVSLDTLIHNFKLINHKVKPAQVIPVVKANAEGLGAVIVSKELEQAGAQMLAVSHFEEACALITGGINTPIMVMNGLLPEQMKIATANDLHFFIYDSESAKWADEVAEQTGKKAKIHIKVDPGMGRLGIMPEQAYAIRQFIHSSDWLELKGIAAHLPSPDDPKHDDYTQEQIDTFMNTAKILDPNHDAIWHIAASSAVLRLPETYLDAVRVGKLSWGVPSSKIGGILPSDVHIQNWDLRAVGAYKARLVQVKALPKGHNVGYGFGYTTQGEMLLGILPIGVVDGLSPKHAGHGYVLVKGFRCKIISVCSCVSMIDVTNVKQVATGDEVVLVGKQNCDEITISEFASFAETGYGGVARKIPARIPRFYKKANRFVAAEIFNKCII